MWVGGTVGAMRAEAEEGGVAEEGGAEGQGEGKVEVVRAVG